MKGYIYTLKCPQTTTLIMDRRQQILHLNCYIENDHVMSTVAHVKLAMDAYAEEMCLSLLEYMAKNNVTCEINDETKEPEFFWYGSSLSKETLFENFL